MKDLPLPLPELDYFNEVVSENRPRAVRVVRLLYSRLFLFRQELKTVF
jgi:hypothetical protein